VGVKKATFRWNMRPHTTQLYMKERRRPDWTEKKRQRCGKKQAVDFRERSYESCMGGERCMV